LPSLPHGGVGVQRACGSVVPAATGVQVPAAPATLQARQVPQLPVVQQTPSTQKPPSHSVPAAQAWPRGLRPHEPALHTWPAAQSASTPQAVRQVVPLQVYTPHDCVVAGRQVPLPSHVRASVTVVPPAGQLAAAHIVPAPYIAHPPPPLHTPVVLQLVAPMSLQAPVGSAPPAGTAEQVPSLPATAHDWQLPPHAVVQQTPCAHTLLVHSAPAAHAAPAGLSPHEPALHVAGGVQSALLAHVARHALAPHANG